MFLLCADCVQSGKTYFGSVPTEFFLSPAL